MICSTAESSARASTAQSTAGAERAAGAAAPERSRRAVGASTPCQATPIPSDLYGHGTKRKRWGSSPGLTLAINLTRSAGSERAGRASTAKRIRRPHRGQLTQPDREPAVPADGPCAARWTTHGPASLTASGSRLLAEYATETAQTALRRGALLDEGARDGAPCMRGLPRDRRLRLTHVGAARLSRGPAVARGAGG